jgi:hypothetical protein
MCNRTSEVHVFDAPRNDGIERKGISRFHPSCVIWLGMFRDRQTIATRVVLDDRSRLPWRFFGRLTTSALTA